MGLTLARSDSVRAASDAGAPPADAGVLPDYARQFRRQTEQIRAFLAGRLDTEVDPQSLFDVPLTAGEGELQVERQRIELLLERASAVASPAVPRAGTAPSPAVGGPRASRSATLASQGGDAGVPPASDRPGSDPRSWRSRLDLDRARLAFYALPRERRAGLIRQQEERQQTAVQQDRSQAMGDAEQAARRAEQQELEARERARRASTEAARLINEEFARLLAITRQQAEYEGTLLQRRAELDGRSEEVLAWRRKVLERTSSESLDAANRALADSTYVDLRRTLRRTRQLLAEVLRTAGDARQLVPEAGPDPLGDLPQEADRSEATQQRAVVLAKTTELKAEVSALEAAEARQLMGEMETLNRLRLDLLGTLSPEKRASVLGFDPLGWDQAASEVRQVMLTLGYHLHAAYGWLAAIRGGSSRGQSAWVAFVLVLKWAFPFALFVWWRRRANGVLATLQRRQREAARARPGNDWLALDHGAQLVAFLRRVRAPLEWLLLVGSVTWLLPAEMRSLLEVSLASTTLLWIFGGHFIVMSIDALAARPAPGLSRPSGTTDTASLRLRSLRLVGRAVVAYGLLLSLSDRVVGQGTIYSWVFSTCWFAALPILLILVSWWRPFIFERFARMRKPNAFESWVLSRRAPPPNLLASILSSAAAVAGGLYVFASGAVRVVRSRVLSFQLTRRLLAYLFQRDLSKKARTAPTTTAYRALPEEIFRALDPGGPCEELVHSVADAQVEDIIRRVGAVGGGAIAIVGERGAGKTTLLGRIARGSQEIISLTCTIDGLPALRTQLNQTLGLSADTTITAAVQTLDRPGGHRGLLIDGAHHLVRPMMGGLADFDAILTLFRTHSKHCTWILAFDEVIWHFIERARGSRPLFDDVVRLHAWSEDAIVRLVTQRNQSAGVKPDFSELAIDLPANADEFEVEQAVRSTEANYYRLLWHYATGNPGIALHFWRRSLGVGGSGRVMVRLFAAPDVAGLEALPDASAFVLRAIVQLGWATAEGIVLVTSLAPEHVADALRYGRQAGYFDVDGPRFRITWDWSRAVTRFLQRRHLLLTTS